MERLFKCILAVLLLTVSTMFRGGKPVRKGDTVVNYGYPLTGQLSDAAKISKGVINALAGWSNDSRHIQYDAPTQPGNSGGPVLDLSGNVVGIVSSGLSQRYAEETGHIAQNVNFAVKSFVAEAFLSSNGVDYERGESVEKMELADIAEQAETFTVLVGCWEGFAEPEQGTSQPEKPEPEQTEPEDTEPEEKVTLKKKEGDTCSDGQIQTYKGCTDIAKAEAEATAALAAAKVRAEAEALAAVQAAGNWTTGATGGLDEATCAKLAAVEQAAYEAQKTGEATFEDYMAVIRSHPNWGYCFCFRHPENFHC